MPAKFLGWVALSCSAFGFWYTFTTLPLALRGEFDPILREFGTPYFYRAYFAMSCTSLVCLAILTWCGVRFVRQKPPPAVFISLMVFETTYLLLFPRLLAFNPEIEMSVTAAIGVANGSLSPQIIILLPLWGSHADEVEDRAGDGVLSRSPHFGAVRLWLNGTYCGV